MKKGKFHYPSTYFLLYPLLAMIYIRTFTTDTNTIMGYGLSQLGYLLIASGIIKGTFLALNLNTRLKTIIVGIISLFIGVVLSNVQ
tara:strand:+ start:106 stop:363 length:258 start_codon:yes stop_codon:yes gene_type:complete